MDELQPGKHPIPGLTHISLHGRRQHGMRGMEMWMETMAPGGGTPMCGSGIRSRTLPGDLGRTAVFAVECGGMATLPPIPSPPLHQQLT